MAFLARHAHVSPETYAAMDARDADALERATVKLVTTELKGHVEIASTLLKGRMISA